MSRILAGLSFLIALSGAAFAQDGSSVPEIDGSTAVSAMALVSGALLVLRSRRK